MTRLSWPLALGYFVLVFVGFAVMFAGVFRELLLEPARPWDFGLLSLGSLMLAGGLVRWLWLARIVRIPPAD